MRPTPTTRSQGRPLRIAFHAPLKAPDHPVPSGDRTMGRALVKALETSGHTVLQPSHLRTFLASPDAMRQAVVERNAADARDRIARTWQAEGPPDLWFTYHNHYKAPDLLGPALAQHFGLPYVLAEASHAPKRAAAWGAWHAAAEAASRAADLHVCFTDRDRIGIAPLLGSGAEILRLPPFLDLSNYPALPSREGPNTVRLITVAMMRPGDKLASYRLLAASLAEITGLDWHLDIIGDGPARPDVEALFATVPAGRVTWHGKCDREGVWSRMAAADLFVWPGFGEAFGLAYLEAQAAGVPAVALDVAGVTSVVRPDVTGWLVAEHTPAAYAAALGRQINDPVGTAQRGRAARRFVRSERSLDAAAAVIDKGLGDLMERKSRRHG